MQFSDRAVLGGGFFAVAFDCVPVMGGWIIFGDGQLGSLIGCLLFVTFFLLLRVAVQNETQPLFLGTKGLQKLVTGGDYYNLTKVRDLFV